MARKLTISDAHSKNKPKQILTLELSGGSPWYCYVWLNDEIHTILVDDETEKITIRPS